MSNEREHEWNKITLSPMDAAFARKMGHPFQAGEEVWYNDISMAMCRVNPNDPDRYPTLLIDNLQDWRKSVFTTEC